MCRYGSSGGGGGTLRASIILITVQRAKLLAQRFQPVAATGPLSTALVTDRVATDLDRQAFGVLVSLTTWAVPLPPPPFPSKPDAPSAGQVRPQPAANGAGVAESAVQADKDFAPPLRVTVAGSRPDTICAAVPGRTAADHAASLGLVPSAAALFVRCSSCGASLALPALLSNSASAVEWLSKQRPHMLSCPACRKTLPRWCVYGKAMGVLKYFARLSSSHVPALPRS